jgi:hypothetical protein
LATCSVGLYDAATVSKSCSQYRTRVRWGTWLFASALVPGDTSTRTVSVHAKAVRDSRLPGPSGAEGGALQLCPPRLDPRRGLYGRTRAVEIVGWSIRGRRTVRILTRVGHLRRLRDTHIVCYSTGRRRPSIKSWDYVSQPARFLMVPC